MGSKTHSTKQKHALGYLYISSRPEVFCKKSVLRNFVEFAIQVVGNFITKEAMAHVFSCNFCEISKNTFSYRTPPVAASLNKKAKLIL